MFYLLYVYLEKCIYLCLHTSVYSVTSLRVYMHVFMFLGHTYAYWEAILVIWEMSKMSA